MPVHGVAGGSNDSHLAIAPQPRPMQHLRQPLLRNTPLPHRPLRPLSPLALAAWVACWVVWLQVWVSHGWRTHSVLALSLVSS